MCEILNSKLLRTGYSLIRNIDFKKLNPKTWDFKKIIWPFRICFHPINGLNDMRYEKKESIFLCILILILWFLSSVFGYLETGFLFNVAKADDLDLKMEFMSTVAVALFWAVSNWAITTLMDGEGNFKQIFTYTCYAILPQVLIGIPVTLISKVAITDEGMFLTLFSTIAFWWTFLLLFLGNMIMHQFSLKKNIFSIVLTICGILILLLIVILGFSLVMQMESFVVAIYTELFHRI